MSSTDHVNFSLRINKNVERKLMFEGLLELRRSFEMKNYKYIGLGSIWFIDFVMAHKKLTIDKMISMEEDEKTYTRANFNKPFNCIDIRDEVSNNIIPRLDLSDEPVLAWLDYDSDLDGPFFDDFSHLCEKAKSGSVIIATVNAHPNNFVDQSSNPDQVINSIGSIIESDVSKSQKIEAIKNEVESTQDNLRRRLDGLEETVDEELIPFGITKRDLTLSNAPKTIAKILQNSIRKVISNNARDVTYRNIFNFSYRDGAPMVTIGGMIVNDEDAGELNESNVWDLHFISGDGNQVNIDLPNLTLQEKKALDSLLPKSGNQVLNQQEIENEYGFQLDQNEVESYFKFYRYYPTYSEVQP